MAKPKKTSTDFLAFQYRPIATIAGKPWVLVPWAILVGWAYHSQLQHPMLSPAYWRAALPPVWEVTSAALLRHLEHLVRIVSYAVVSLLIGRQLQKRLLGPMVLNAFESVAYWLALGLGGVSLACFMLGAVHAFSSPVVTSAAVAALRGVMAESRPQAGRSFSSLSRNPS